MQEKLDFVSQDWEIETEKKYLFSLSQQLFLNM